MFIISYVDMYTRALAVRSQTSRAERVEGGNMLYKYTDLQVFSGIAYLLSYLGLSKALAPSRHVLSLVRKERLGREGLERSGIGVLRIGIEIYTSYV